MEFPFYDSPDTITIICCHIVENQVPILYVSHDEDDGMWQFLCGETHGIAINSGCQKSAKSTKSVKIHF